MPRKERSNTGQFAKGNKGRPKGAKNKTTVATGSHEAVKILTPAKMKRADYRACVNAAKAILKSAK